MNLRSLRYFVAVIDAGGFSRAAAALDIAQPALSAQIQRLEKSLGTKLLERSHAGVMPTTAGMELYRGALRLLADADALSSRIGGRSGPLAGTVTIAFPALLAPVLLGGFLVQVRERHPQIQTHVLTDSTEVVQESVVNGKADFGMLADVDVSLGLAARPIVEEPHHFMGIDPKGVARRYLRPPSDDARRHPLDVYPEIRFSDAAALPIITTTRRFIFRRRLDQVAEQLGIELNVIHEHESVDALEALYDAGAGFVFVTAGWRRQRTADPNEIRARVVDPQVWRPVSIAWHAARKLSEPALAVIEVLRAEVATAIAEGRWPARHLDLPDYEFD